MPLPFMIGSSSPPDEHTLRSRSKHAAFHLLTVSTTGCIDRLWLYYHCYVILVGILIHILPS